MPLCDEWSESEKRTNRLSEGIRAAFAQQLTPLFFRLIVVLSLLMEKKRNDRSRTLNSATCSSVRLVAMISFFFEAEKKGQRGEKTTVMLQRERGVFFLLIFFSFSRFSQFFNPQQLKKEKSPFLSPKARASSKKEKQELHRFLFSFKTRT